MQHALELLDSITDLHLGNISSREWLERMTAIAKCRGTCTASWTAGEPDTVIFDYSEQPILINQDWIAAADELLARAQPSQPDLLDVIARSTGSLPAAADDPLNNRNLMIGFVDDSPARTLLIMSCDHKPKGWTKTDRDRFQGLLPVLKKAHLVHKKITLAENHLDIANKVLDSVPRGIVTFTKDFQILKANNMGYDILALNDLLKAQGDQLVIQNDLLRAEVYGWLRAAWAMKSKDLSDAVWHQGFQSKIKGLSYQLTLRVFPLANWHLESNPHKLFAALYIGLPESPATPTVSQLKEFYGLTRAQARLVLSLLNGNSITDASDELNISVNTARSHLRSIYSKLGVNNKAELLRLLSATLVEYTSTHKMLRPYI